MEIYVLSPQDSKGSGRGGVPRHIYRQANKLVDGLAKVAYGLDTRIYFHKLAVVPHPIQKLLFVDRIGLPYFRPKCN